jgi:nucleotide-binding universal stress UspA family protein
MFTHLLVPLDGSTLAEQALPAAAYLAQVLTARVTLLHLIEHNPPSEIHHDRHLTNAAEAQVYLEEVQQRTFAADEPVAYHVHTSEIDDVARSIVEHIRELAPDLIVMCAHGEGGLRRRLTGSKAQQVIAQCTTPIVLIPPTIEGRADFHCSRIVVPLDGNAEHEEGLRISSELARVCRAALHLLYVIPTVDRLKGDDLATGRLMPHTMSAILDMRQEDAAAYLGQLLVDLRETGLTVSGEVARGEVIDTILAAIKRQQADLVAIGTHATSGMDAIWEGSVTPVLSDRSPAPLLLVPIHAET